MGIATAIIAIGITVTVALGPERIGRRFEEEPVVGLHDVWPKADEESLGDEKMSRRDTLVEDGSEGSGEKGKL